MNRYNISLTSASILILPISFKDPDVFLFSTSHKDIALFSLLFHNPATK